jgi:hypothetical protein
MAFLHWPEEYLSSIILVTQKETDYTLQCRVMRLFLAIIEKIQVK